MRVQCSECWEDVVLGSLAVHLQTKHRKTTGGRRNWVTTAHSGDPYTYKMSFSTAGGPMNCPIEGCWGQAVIHTAMRSIFSTGMSGIPLLYWRRETPPTHIAPGATCWCPGGR